MVVFWILACPSQSLTKTRSAPASKRPAAIEFCYQGRNQGVNVIAYFSLRAWKNMSDAARARYRALMTVEVLGVLVIA